VILFLLILRLRDKMPHAGDLFKLYVVGYSSFRFLVDFTRADPRIFAGLTLVQLVYSLTILGFTYSLWQSLSESRRHVQMSSLAPESQANRTI
jgi:prolipoprotein diacylglyceryltransferase